MSLESMLPVVALQLLLIIFALVNLIRRDKSRVRGGNKWVWGAVIVLFNMDSESSILKN